MIIKIKEEYVLEESRKLPVGSCMLLSVIVCEHEWLRVRLKHSRYDDYMVYKLSDLDWENRKFMKKLLKDSNLEHLLDKI